MITKNIARYSCDTIVRFQNIIQQIVIFPITCWSASIFQIQIILRFYSCLH